MIYDLKAMGVNPAVIEKIGENGFDELNDLGITQEQLGGALQFLKKLSDNHGFSGETEEPVEEAVQPSEDATIEVGMDSIPDLQGKTGGLTSEQVLQEIKDYVQNTPSFTSDEQNEKVRSIASRAQDEDEAMNLLKGFVQ